MTEAFAVKGPDGKIIAAFVADEYYDAERMFFRAFPEFDGKITIFPVTVSEKGEADELASAAEQILDDMGSDYCVCPAAKEQLRMALDAHLSRKEPK